MVDATAIELVAYLAADLAAPVAKDVCFVLGKGLWCYGSVAISPEVGLALQAWKISLQSWKIPLQTGEIALGLQRLALSWKVNLRLQRLTLLLQGLRGNLPLNGGLQRLSLWLLAQWLSEGLDDGLQGGLRSHKLVHVLFVKVERISEDRQVLLGSCGSGATGIGPIGHDVGLGQSGLLFRKAHGALDVLLMGIGRQDRQR